MHLLPPSPLTYQNILTAFSDYLSGKAVDSPRLSARLLITHILGISHMQSIMQPDRPVSMAEWKKMHTLICRRGEGEPVAYLLENQEFYSRTFAVSPDTLIPRPETEHIIEAVLAHYDRNTSLRFADLGTGSGCIAITLCAEMPNISGVAADKSTGALRIARKNAATHNVTQAVQLVQADFTTTFIAPQSLDLIVTNPPYISEAEYAELAHEVKDYEPQSALVPGSTGLEHPLRLIRNATVWLKSGGLFLMEIGWQQGNACVEALYDSSDCWHSQQIIKDLSGHDRIVSAIRR